MKPLFTHCLATDHTEIRGQPSVALAAACGLLIALLLSPAFAAEAPTPATDSGTSQTSTEASSDTITGAGSDSTTNSNRPLTGSEARRANDKGGVFRPSEDISEDLAVSFPVDI